MKVEHQFPTGFVCQPVIDRQERIVNGAKKSNLDIHAQLIDELTNDKNDFIDKRTTAWKVLEDEKSTEEQRLANFEVLRK